MNLPAVIRISFFIAILTIAMLTRSEAQTPAAECAYNLAVIDAGGRVSKNSNEVARLTQLVANISRLTKESPETIGDCTVFTQEYLEKQGVKVSSYRLLTETYNTLRGVPAGTVTFKDTLALVGTLLAVEK